MIEKIVNGSYLKRIDNIIQWQERDVFNKESVSQHSYKVSVFVRILLEDIFNNPDCSKNFEIQNFKLDCVTHAMFHDWDEAIFMRDLSHAIKYNDFNGNQIRQVIDDYVKHEFVKEFDTYQDTCAYKVLAPAVVCLNPCVKKVVKLGDWLALLFYCRREIALENANFEKTYMYCRHSVIKAAQDVVEVIDQRFGIDASNLIETIQTILKSSVYGENDY